MHDLNIQSAFTRLLDNSSANITKAATAKRIHPAGARRTRKPKRKRHDGEHNVTRTLPNRTYKPSILTYS